MSGILIIALVPTVVTLLFISFRASIFRYVSKKKWSKDPPDEQATHFLEGASVIWNNPFFLGVASAKTFSPSAFAEYLYYGDLQSWGLFLIRLVALSVCAVFWNWLRKLGFESVGHYLKQRFKSRFLVGLFNVNVLLGTIYIYALDAGPLTYAFMDFIKTNNFLIFTFIAFLLVTSLGGFKSTMFAVMTCCLLDILGRLLFAIWIPPPDNFGKEISSTPIPPCAPNLGLNEFLPVLSHLVAVLPIYNLLRTAKTIKKLWISLAICVAVLFVDHIWTMVLISKVKEVGMHNAKMHPTVNKRTSLWTRSFLGSFNLSGVDEDVPTWNPPADMKCHEFELQFWGIPTAGAVVLFWSILSPLNIFTALQMHYIAVHIIEHCMPSWLRDVVITSVVELKLVYICVRFFFSIVVIILIDESLYELVGADYKGYIVHIPYKESGLIISVLLVVIIGWAMHSVGTTLICALAVIQIVGAHFVSEMLQQDLKSTDFVVSETIWEQRVIMDFTRLCSAAWVPSLVTMALLFLVLLALVCCRGNHRIFSRYESFIEESETTEDSDSSSETE